MRVSALYYLFDDNERGGGGQSHPLDCFILFDREWCGGCGACGKGVGNMFLFSMPFP